MTIPKSEQRQAAFRSACKRAVAQRSPEGSIPTRTSIPLTYKDLQDIEFLSARIWVEDQMRAAMVRLDGPCARAWLQVKDRLKRYDRLRITKADQR